MMPIVAYVFTDPIWRRGSDELAADRRRALYTFEKLPAHDTPFVLLFLGAAIAHAIGYSIQDGLSLVGVVSISPLKKPPRLVRFLHNRFNRVRFTWEDVASFDLHQLLLDIRTNASPLALAELSRVITLKHLCATMGGASLISSVFLSVKAVGSKSSLDIALAVSIAVFAALLIALEWIQACEQTALAWRIHDSKTGEPHNTDSGLE